MVAANGIYKLAVIGTVAGQQHIHTLHFRATTDPDGVLMDEDTWQTDLVNQWRTAAGVQYRALFHTTALPVQSHQVRKVCGSVPLPAGVDVAEPGATSAGTGSSSEYNSEALAPWLATVTTHRTALAGRRYRGRSFIGGLHEASVIGAVVQAVRITTLTAYYDALRAAFITPLEVDTPRKLFVYSKRQIELFPSTPCQNSGADVRTFQVRDQLATMKSRKAGSGI